MNIIMAKKNFKLKIGNYDPRGEKLGEDIKRKFEIDGLTMGDLSKSALLITH